MKTFIITAALTFPVFAFAAQPDQENILDTQTGQLNIRQDVAGTRFVSDTLTNDINFNGQADVSESEDIAAVLVPDMAKELSRKQAAESIRIGQVSASGAATPDELYKALMVKAQQQGASGYRITSVGNMSPYWGTATLYR